MDRPRDLTTIQFGELVYCCLRRFGPPKSPRCFLLIIGRVQIGFLLRVTLVFSRADYFARRYPAGGGRRAPRTRAHLA